MTALAAIVGVGVIGVLGLAGALSAQTPPTGYAAVVIDDVPATYLRLGEASGTFADSSPAGTHPGTKSTWGISNGSLFFRAQPGGIVGDDGAVRDDAAPSGATLEPNGAFVSSAAPGVSGGQAPFSFEIWAKPLPHSGEGAPGGGFGGGMIGDYDMDTCGCQNYGTGLFLNWPSRIPTFVRRTSSDPAPDVVNGPALQASAWSHVVTTYDGSTMRMYINGGLAGSLPSTKIVGGGIGPIRIGMFRFDYGITDYPGYFYGSLDEAAIYGRALTDQEIAEHYAAGTSLVTQAGRQSFGTRGRFGVHGRTGGDIIADPVNTLTGAFTESVEDLSLPGTGVPFMWMRTYTSADPTVGRLGAGWTDNYAVSLTIAGDGDVTLHGDEGQQIEYTKQGDGSFVGAAGTRSKLESITGGYNLTRQDQVVYSFDDEGRATSVKDRNGEGVTLAYDGQSRLAEPYRVS